MPPNGKRTIVVVGAGPAGLFCANTLAATLKSKARVVVLEKGKPAAERFLSEEQWRFRPAAVLEGEGGPGFLADAKLCVSADAGTQFDRSFRDIYPQAVQDLDFYIYAALLELGHEVRRFEPNRYALAAARHRLESLRLTLETYPVRALGSDLAKAFLTRFVKGMLKAGVDLRFEAEVTEIRHRPKARQPFELQIQDSSGFSSLGCAQLILAVGRSGAAWLSKQKIPIQQEPNHLDIGIRVEFPRWGGEQIRELGENPKVKLKDGSSYAKTHCFVHCGRVISYLMEEECFVDAHAVSAKATGASSINLLYRVDETLVETPRKLYESVRVAADAIAPHQTLRMPVPEFLGTPGLPSAGSEFSPTMLSAPQGDLTLVFPERVIAALRSLLRQLARFAPGIAVQEGVVYAPAAEWLSPRIRVEPYFRAVGVDDLWCIGDGSGLTSGVLPAAASGVVAAIQVAEDSKQPTFTWRLP